MTHDALATAETNRAPKGAGYVLPLIGSIVLTLLWGSYMVWDVFEILRQHP